MENETVNKNMQIPFLLLLFDYIHKAIVYLGRYVFRLYYGTKTNHIKPIQNDIIKKSASEIASLIRNGKLSSVKLIEAYKERNEQVNPYLNYLVEDRYEEAMKEAAIVDEMINSGKYKVDDLSREKPLLGVPFTTKDCIAVKGMPHTGGVTLRKDVRADKDATAIRQLRDAGAIPIALTNVPELCMWWETHNHMTGRTSNPYDSTRIVGGSSGGEGVIQAVAGSSFGVGSDIGGSIRMPAFFNGVFGHKPSWNTVSLEGQFPEARSDMQKIYLGIGPMVRHAEDLQPLLAIMAGENAGKLKLNESVDLKDIKVFYQLDNLGSPLVSPVDDEIKGCIQKGVEYLKELHGIPVEMTKIIYFYKSNPIWLTTMKDKTSFAKLITGNDSILNIVKEIVKNIFGMSDNTMIGLFTALFERTGPQYGDEKYGKYVKVRAQFEKVMSDLLGDNGVFIYPTHPTVAPYHNEPLLRPLNFSYSSIINCLGFPATHIPCGLGKEGLPIGFQVVSNMNNDRLCIAVAREMEKCFGGWVEP